MELKKTQLFIPRLARFNFDVSNDTGMNAWTEFSNALPVW